MLPRHGCNALHHTPTKLVARAGVEPASAAFQTAAETASATRPLANLVEPIGVEPISPACKAGALPYELRSRFKTWWSVPASNRSAFRIANAVSTPSTPTPRLLPPHPLVPARRPLFIAPFSVLESVAPVHFQKMA